MNIEVGGWLLVTYGSWIKRSSKGFVMVLGVELFLAMLAHENHEHTN
jgi:hypothetical protein